MHRIFVDTNILISGLAFGGNEAHLIRLAAAGDVRLVISSAVLYEIRDVIVRKFPELTSDLEELLEKISWEAVEHPDMLSVESALEIVRDPDDAPILASILLAKPDYAITGDKDLLTDEVKAVAPVCRCSEYMELIAKD